MKILQNYKNKQCKTWVGNYFQRLIFTWIYKLYTSIVLVVIAAIAYNFIQEGSVMENFITSMYTLGLFGFVLIAIVLTMYAFIFNPIRALKDKFKKK